jgi:hypothetical protein
MKGLHMKLLYSLFAAISALALWAADAPFFPAKNAIVTGAALVEKGDTMALAFKLPDNSAGDFSLINIYLFADQDRNTGRKGMGNEYYFDIPKGMISTYDADGKGTLHRNALNQFLIGGWYIITFDKSLTAAAPIKEFEIIFNGMGKRNVLSMRGKAPKMANLPEIPERHQKAPAAAKAPAVKVSGKNSSGKEDHCAKSCCDAPYGDAYCCTCTQYRKERRGKYSKDPYDPGGERTVLLFE